MGLHVVPGDQLSAFRTDVLFHFFLQPLFYSHLLQAAGIRDHMGVIVDAVDDRPLAENFQPLTGEAGTLVTAADLMLFYTVPKSMLALPAACPQMVG